MGALKAAEEADRKTQQAARGADSLLCGMEVICQASCGDSGCSGAGPAGLAEASGATVSPCSVAEEAAGVAVWFVSAAVAGTTGVVAGVAAT